MEHFLFCAIYYIIFTRRLIMIIKKNLVPKEKYSIKCPYTMNPRFVVVHNTSNKASAENEVSYMVRNNNQTSFHYAVDDKMIVQGIEENRNAWASGDGAKGNGNRYGIHIEICYSTGDVELFKASEKNACKFIAKILHERNWNTKEHLKRHCDFSSKNCPHKTNELGWKRFVTMVDNELIKLNQNTPFLVRIKSDTLNIRKEPTFTSQVVGVVKKGEVFTIVEVSGELGKLKSGVGWISLNTPYTEKL